MDKDKKINHFKPYKKSGIHFYPQNYYILIMEFSTVQKLYT